MRFSLLSRRRFVLAGSIGAALLMLPSLLRARTGNRPAKRKKMRAKETLPLSFVLNGKTQKVEADTRTTLLDLLRENLHLMGTKKGCDHGQCGACTVHINGQRVLSCLTLAATLPGKKVMTIEGISDGEELHPMQEAFIAHDGFQCGYCTPGQIMSAIGCVKEGHTGSVAEIKEAMSGNLCRCGAYNGIVNAIQSVARA